MSQLYTKVTRETITRGELVRKPEAERVLRDVAYVLKLTQAVKASILDGRPLNETVRG